MTFKITGGRFYGALIVALSAWILQSFLLPLLVACVTAIASWPLYKQFVARLPRRMPPSATSLIFTSVMTLFVLAPLMFAVGALLAEAHALFLPVAAADDKGIAVPHWVENVPRVGPWLAARWQSELAHPGALSVWTQRTDPTALLGWAQSLGQFMARHVFIIAFTILILFFLYQEGESLAEEFRRVLRLVPHGVPRRLRGAWPCGAGDRSGRAYPRKGIVGTVRPRPRFSKGSTLNVSGRSRHVTFNSVSRRGALADEFIASL